MRTEDSKNTEQSATIDFLPLLGTDFVEFYVGNAKQAAHYYKTAFGYQSLAYSGPETGNREKVSYVLKQDKVRLILTTALMLFIKQLPEAQKLIWSQRR